MPTWELLCHMMFFQHGVGLGPAHAQSVLYGGGNIRRHIANDYDTILVKNREKNRFKLFEERLVLFSFKGALCCVEMEAFTPRGVTQVFLTSSAVAPFNEYTWPFVMKFSVTVMVCFIKGLSCCLLVCFAQHSSDGMVGDRIIWHTVLRRKNYQALLHHVNSTPELL